MDTADLSQLPLVLSVEQVGRLLGVSRSAAYEAVRRREVPSIRIGRRVLVPRAALERLLAECNVPTDPHGKSAARK